MPSMRHNISALGLGCEAERLCLAICVKNKRGAMNAVFPVTDVGGAQAGVILRRRQVGASPRCAGNAALQLMVHTALTSIFFGADDVNRTSD